MTGNIFINYRRGDDPGFTQALYSRLEQAFRLSGCYWGILPIAAQSGWVTAAWSYFNDVFGYRTAGIMLAGVVILSALAILLCRLAIFRWRGSLSWPSLPST